MPSLRYWSHLVGPGWNVIGGGEPEIPGISIGYNEHGAWGQLCLILMVKISMFMRLIQIILRNIAI